jgi:hypothetical protein
MEVSFLWKKELVEMLFSNNPSKLDPKKAIKFKYMQLPDNLFKYKSFDESHSLELLKTDNLCLSTPAQFNDPYDCALKLIMKDVNNDYLKNKIFEHDSELLREQLGVSIKKLNKLRKSKNLVYDICLVDAKKEYPKSEYQNIDHHKIALIMQKKNNKKLVDLQNLKNKIYISCFSETNKSILMWSHYSKNHQGFCIEYDFTQLGMNHYITRFLFPIIYSNDIFDISDYIPHGNKGFKDVLSEYSKGINLQEFIKGLKSPEKTNVNNMVLFYAALNKFKDWEYEKEWRYVFPYQNPSQKQIYIKTPQPKAIYLGAMVSEQNQNKILELANKRKISVYKMEMNSTEFILEPKIIQS